MRKLLYLLAFSVFSILAKGEGISFSGTWNLNKEKSTLLEQYSMAPDQLIITQTADSIHIERHGKFQDQEFTVKDVFSLDGKECVNVAWMDVKKKSTAVWSDEGKTLTIVSKVPGQDGREIVIKELIQMQEPNLKVVVSVSGSFGETTETQVFDKK